MNFILLGSGTSQGIPVIGCHCATCKSNNPKNFRTRTSAFLSYNDRNVVIDTSTEFRLQIVQNDIKRLDAVLFSHSHADHVHGLDDIRQFNKMQRTTIPCYGDAATLGDIRRKYDYVFKTTQAGGGKPDITLHEVNGDFELFGRTVIPLPIKHGVLDILGYRVGELAYITDASAVPAATMEKLNGLDVLIINALRYIPHPTHFSVGQAIRIIEELRPRIAYLTHIGHLLEHERLEQELPDGVRMGYDGLTLTIPG